MNPKSQSAFHTEHRTFHPSLPNSCIIIAKASHIAIKIVVTQNVSLISRKWEKREKWLTLITTSAHLLSPQQSFSFSQLWQGLSSTPTRSVVLLDSPIKRKKNIKIRLLFISSRKRCDAFMICRVLSRRSHKAGARKPFYYWLVLNCTESKRHWRPTTPLKWLKSHPFGILRRAWWRYFQWAQ